MNVCMHIMPVAKGWQSRLWIISLDLWVLLQGRGPYLWPHQGPLVCRWHCWPSRPPTWPNGWKWAALGQYWLHLWRRESTVLPANSSGNIRMRFVLGYQSLKLPTSSRKPFKWYKYCESYTAQGLATTRRLNGLRYPAIIHHGDIYFTVPRTPGCDVPNSSL